MKIWNHQPYVLLMMFVVSKTMRKNQPTKHLDIPMLTKLKILLLIKIFTTWIRRNQRRDWLWIWLHYTICDHNRRQTLNFKQNHVVPDSKSLVQNDYENSVLMLFENTVQVQSKYLLIYVQLFFDYLLGILRESWFTKDLDEELISTRVCHETILKSNLQKCTILHDLH